MTFDPTMAETRFGCGLSPVVRPASEIGEIFARLRQPDLAAASFPIPGYDALTPEIMGLLKARKVYKRGNGEQSVEAKASIRKMRKASQKRHAKWLAHSIGRRATSPDGFRERLAFFWADHFTAKGDGAIIRQAAPTYWEDAIRPNITGNFRDLLMAAVTHPLMLLFLDQTRSIGPNSKVAKRRKKKPVGLNENLAREVLELHTLGVNGPYSQKDVRQLAELFTGLSYKRRDGFVFRKALAEPGEEAILGKYYGGNPAELRDVYAALADLAVHPATARHIAWKLAVHFVSDRPDLDLIDSIAQRFLDSDGDLMETYRALLEHPAAWSREASNIKQPIEFISSSLRALAITPQQIKKIAPGRARSHLHGPMIDMGQNWDSPLGPDGWSEEDGHWLTPQAMATRMQWALVAPKILLGTLPDPRDFVGHALGDTAPETVKFAARAAETKWEGVALVLVSPAFQRR